MTANQIPVSIVIPTRNRSKILRRALESSGRQTVQPAEIIIVDASPGQDTRNDIVEASIAGMTSELIYLRAEIAGAAVQRNQGVAIARHDVIGFFDDDIILEPECMARLWSALQSDPELGGVNAMITNQRYFPPGAISRALFAIMAGGARDSYAGAVLGPAVNLLPEDRDDLGDVVATEWLNLGATLYRQEALPVPPFQGHFKGYSLMEDLALSSAVARSWKLANARTARIFHDSQPGDHKSSMTALSRMELVNRHYVMTKVLERRRLGDYAKLLLWEIFQLAVSAIQARLGRKFWQNLRGKFQGLREIWAK